MDGFGPPLWHFGLANGKFESVIQVWGVEVQFYIPSIYHSRTVCQGEGEGGKGNNNNNKKAQDKQTKAQ